MEARQGIRDTRGRQGPMVNRFGDLTAVRWPCRQLRIRSLRSDSGQDNPVQSVYHSIRSQAGTEGRHTGHGLGPLFWAEHVLIGAAVVLIGLLFVFSVEARTSQIGTLLALGLDVHWSTGCCCGRRARGSGRGLDWTLLGLGYTRALIAGSLRSGREQLQASRSSSMSGPLPGDRAGWSVTALAVMAWTLRRQVRHTAHSCWLGLSRILAPRASCGGWCWPGVSGLAIAGAILLSLCLAWAIVQWDCRILRAGSLLLIVVWPGQGPSFASSDSSPGHGTDTGSWRFVISRADLAGASCNRDACLWCIHGDCRGCE